VTPRQATRDELRAWAWSILLYRRDAPEPVRASALRVLAALDQEEVCETKARRYVALLLGHSRIETTGAGRLRLTWPEPEPAA
jgi:hypothetical protein